MKKALSINQGGFQVLSFAVISIPSPLPDNRIDIKYTTAPGAATGRL